MRLQLLLAAFLFSLFAPAQSPDSLPPKIPFSDTLIRKMACPSVQPFFQPAFFYNRKRTQAVVLTEATLASGSLIALSQLWYKQYPHSAFHTFNDNAEWMQMDKCGHSVTAYTVGRYGMRLLQWGGVQRKKAIWFGGLTGFAYQGVIEIFDGFSSGWGFSTGDIAANTLGSGILIAQELAWNEQRFTLKYSFRKSGYAQYRPNILGESWQEEILKDYNGQTYWLSCNIASFFPGQKFIPKFLNLAFGYGANGMIGGNSNPVIYNSSGAALGFERYRQYYLSFDIDLTKIPTHSYVLKAVFETFGFLKIPAPGVELSRNKVSGKWLAY